VLAAPGLVMAHGSLHDPQEYVLHDSQAAHQLDTLAREYPTADLLVLGHTHQTWVYSQREGTLPTAAGSDVPLPPGRVLLNPGSVGQSRQRERRPLARCMLVDLERRQARVLGTAYDVAACRRALRRHGLPGYAVHLRPVRLATLRRRAEGRLHRDRPAPS